MSALVAVDRNVLNVPVLLGQAQACAPAVNTQSSANLVLLPRCTVKVEKCRDGAKLLCTCVDEKAVANLQNACTLLCSGTVCCVVQLNGCTLLTCNLTAGLCQCEPTSKGVCISCCSGDQQCCRIIQESCSCLAALLECGCTCCVCMSNTPVCCGTC